MNETVKPGYKTTEFWLTLIVTLVTSFMAVLVIYGVVTTEQATVLETFILSVVAVVLPIMTITMNQKYALGRNNLKQESINPGAYIGGTLEIISEEDKELEELPEFEPLPPLNWGIVPRAE